MATPPVAMVLWGWQGLWGARKCWRGDGCGQALLLAQPREPDSGQWDCAANRDARMETVMNVEVDFRSHIPIYLQILSQIKEKVATGALQPGNQLPTVRQMAADLRVNFNTVARAYRILGEAG